MYQCAGCGNDINGSSTNFNGQYYHPQCFICSSCCKQLSNSQFNISDGKRNCAKCAAENSGPKCIKCRKSFLPGEQFKVLPDGNYHNGCFVCDGPCERPLAGSFYTIRNKRVCGNCYQQYGNDFEKYIKKKEEPKPEPKKEEPKKEKKRVPIYY